MRRPNGGGIRRRWCRTSPGEKVAWARIPPVSMPGSTRWTVEPARSAAAFTEGPIPTVYAAVPGVTPAWTLSTGTSNGPEHGPGDEASAVDDDHGRSDLSEKRDRPFVVHRRDKTVVVAHRGSGRGCGPARAAAPGGAHSPEQQRQDQRDERHLSPTLPPAEPAGTAAGQLEPGGRPLQDHRARQLAQTRSQGVHDGAVQHRRPARHRWPIAGQEPHPVTTGRPLGHGAALRIAPQPR